jgi:hypothetical protein
MFLTWVFLRFIGEVSRKRLRGSLISQPLARDTSPA